MRSYGGRILGSLDYTEVRTHFRILCKDSAILRIRIT